MCFIYFFFYILFCAKFISFSTLFFCIILLKDIALVYIRNIFLCFTVNLILFLNKMLVLYCWNDYKFLNVIFFMQFFYLIIFLLLFYLLFLPNISILTPSGISISYYVYYMEYSTSTFFNPKYNTFYLK